MGFEKVHDGGMACLEITQFLLGKTQHVQHFVLFPLVVVIESLLQVVTNADVINDKALVLPAAAHPVHTGDCLEEAMRNDDFVKVHHLLHRGIEPGKQHVVHNHNANIARDAFVLGIKR